MKFFIFSEDQLQSINIAERALPGSATTWQPVKIARHDDTAFETWNVSKK